MLATERAVFPRPSIFNTVSGISEFQPRIALVSGLAQFDIDGTTKPTEQPTHPFTSGLAP